MRRILIVLCLFGLSACAAVEAETPAQRVFALKSDYRAVLILATTYESLPSCPNTSEPVCSDPDVVDLIRGADDKAAFALDGAEQVVRSEVASESTASLAIEAARKALEVLRQILIEEGVI